MNKLKLLQIIIVLLVALNVASLTVVSIRKPNHANQHQRNHAKGEGPKKQIIQRLNFTSVQIEAYEALIAKHRQSIQQKDEAILSAKNSLYTGLTDESNSDPAAEMKKLSLAILEVEKLHYQHFIDLKNLCTLAQMKNFNQLTEDLSHVFQHKPPKR